MNKPSAIETTLQLAFRGPPVLATGSRHLNTLCITGGDQAHVTHNIGDLETTESCSLHEMTATEIVMWQQSIPAVIARGLDPESYASRFSIELAANLGVPHIAVQHHHAHVAAVCLEHSLMGPVIALVFDETGMGTDGASWGGELLLVDGADCTRLAHLLPVVRPGGAIAEREAWRLAAGALHQLRRGDEIRRRFRDHPDATEIATMLAEQRNCTYSTSAYLYATIAATFLRLLPLPGAGLSPLEALETAAQRYFESDYIPLRDTRWRIDADGNLDFYPLLHHLIDEGNRDRGAATFHANFIAGGGQWAAEACQRTGIRNVILTGACMNNRLLAMGLRNFLERQGLLVHEARQLQPDDSAISAGQAWVALMTHQSGRAVF